MAGGLPPPPTRAANGDFAWTAWYNQLYTMLSTSGSVSWALVNKAGSSIADLANHAHNLLTGMQGGTSNEYYHLTAAEHASLSTAWHSPVTKTADFTLADNETWIINNKAGSACTVTFPAASLWPGREVTIKNMQAQLVNSVSANVVPLDSTTAGTAILLGVVGNWATLVSDGTNWVIMQAAPNNVLLLG
jgi:hypothetical protein